MYPFKTVYQLKDSTLYCLTPLIRFSSCLHTLATLRIVISAERPRCVLWHVSRLIIPFSPPPPPLESYRRISFLLKPTQTQNRPPLFNICYIQAFYMLGRSRLPFVEAVCLLLSFGRPWIATCRPLNPPTYSTSCTVCLPVILEHTVSHARPDLTNR